MQDALAYDPVLYSSRRLQQSESATGPTQEPTLVRTPEELQAAVVDGKAYIEIQEHLDLTNLTLIEGEAIAALLGAPPPAVKSISVSCSIISL